ncbi:putative PurR-regulated permease PerM [Kibdelosporangium banguiense]|uniref:PurR-regulated permease PerM n=1 Tax=Kibdelosporangium banguiense TaxID=1365924 RepID=A0ABS4TW38_9PSEU|nr:AI-2E family transporter [Kibdelosporangium banguiense]MBP2328622.1 putative PurR-regulated permease PerM [Kibdelosporangium banguiense]
MSERQDVPRPLRLTAAYAWRLVVIAAALYVAGTVVGYLGPVVVPVAVALLLAALLTPAVGFLTRHRIPRGLSVALVLLAGLVVIAALLTFVVQAFIDGLPALRDQLGRSVGTISDWLMNGPLHLSNDQVRQFSGRIVHALTDNQAKVTTGAITTATTIGEFLAQMLLVLFVLIFLMYDGADIWNFLLGAVPHRTRQRVDVAGRQGLASLVSYVRATVAVATVDAVGIGIGLWAVGVPLVIPLATLVFLGAFVPIVGAVVAGGAAVLVALVANGPVPALIVLGVVILVQQLEGHVLQPFLLGRAVKLHPVAVVLAIAAGVVTAGIVGALLSVPLLAVLNSGIRSLRSPADEGTDPDDVHSSQPEVAEPGRTDDDADQQEEEQDRPPARRQRPRHHHC